jgi:hypothetical protein
MNFSPNTVARNKLNEFSMNPKVFPPLERGRVRVGVEARIHYRV